MEVINNEIMIAFIEYDYVSSKAFNLDSIYEA